MPLSEVDRAKVSAVMDMIIADTEADLIRFEGQPFKGATVAEYFGSMGAQVQALAKAVKRLVED